MTKKDDKEEIKIQNLCKNYGKTKVLKNISLSIQKGEFLSLLGPSGCGKSTLLRIIAGLEQLDSGALLYQQNDFSRIPVQKRRIGMVFQNYALFPNMTVLENVCFGLESQKRLGKKEIAKKAVYWLERVGLAGLEKRYPHELSGGQQQRVAIARAIATEPEILLLDEPLSALDAIVRANLRTEIRQLQMELGITTIYVTHDQSEALAMSDRIAIMHDGRLLEVERPEKVYYQPQNLFTAQFLGTTNQVEGIVLKEEPVTVLLQNKETLLLHKCGFKVNKGDKIAVCTKADDLKLVEEKAENTISGELLLESFLGNAVQYKVKMQDGELLLVNVPIEKVEKRRIGDTVYIKIPKKSINSFKLQEENMMKGSVGYAV